MIAHFYEVKIKAKVWVFDGPTAWYMVTIPAKQSKQINKEFGDRHRGWGSIPVLVTLGKTTWKTSIFWEKKGTYVMAIKKEIRKKEKVTSGDVISIKLQIEYGI